MHEFDLIRKHLAPLAGAAGLALQDDAATLTPPTNQQLIITTDTLNEAVHFKPHSDPYQLAQKALRVNLSDLAAMGATPLGYSLSLSLPAGTTEAFIAAFCAGLKADQAAYNLSLLGGDTTKTTGPLSISITAYGTTPKPLLRSGAKAGEHLYVSGQIGAGFLGLHEHCTNSISHYQCPTPRLALGQLLRAHASACMDISDGLVQDLGHLCAASGVGATIELARIPLADAAHDPIAQITGGDDYELLFTAPANLALNCATPITAIGRITQAPSITWLDAAGQPIRINKGGWQHF